MQTVRDCWIDPERLAPLAEALNPYRPPGRDDPDWPHSTLSVRTVAYSCGALRRAGDPVTHHHDPAELVLCARLAADTAGTMEGTEIGMGNEGYGVFLPFFVAANADAPFGPELNADLIRRAFGGTIYPPAQVVVEPLEERGRWWQSVHDDYFAEEDDTDYGDLPRPDPLLGWRRMIQWFKTGSGLRQCSFVMIGETPLDPRHVNAGCIHPRLAVGLTAAGSLVGICGCVTHT